MQFIWNLVLSSLSGHVCLPGLRGQAANPALGGARSTSCYILLAERWPHKCLSNSQLIHNNAAGPLKSTKTKMCETVKARFLGWLARLEAVQKDRVLFRLCVFWPCPWCSSEQTASLTSLEAFVQTHRALSLPQGAVWHWKPDTQQAKWIPSYARSHYYFLWLAPEMSQGPYTLAKNPWHHLYY